MVGKSLIYAVLFVAVLNKGMSIGNFTMFLALAVSFSESMLDFLQRFGDYKKASLEVDDFRSFMELDIEEKVDTIPIPSADKYTIRFHDVSYRYQKTDKDAVSHLNMTLHPGEKLAVVGLNGAGKTTMIKLLLRLYDPTEGYISLNGIDIRRFNREDYYRLFAPVFQDVEVFAFPIVENISMKTPNKTDRKRAEEAIREAGLLDKILSLPKGIESELLKIVDEEGIDLSGGEKQKLALARALYKAAPIVVLDEPTSALDAIAEQQLYERFDQMIGKKAAVYISHRLASTRFCDKVAMFKDGAMIEYGSHGELMVRGGEYAKMFEVQAQYYQEKRVENQ
ncbi:MAG: ABC transporter ATP-binding protein [Clostridiales bacterium]|nr:ABC transporter ATP-binding protein [Clostridiales bacterium]